jgi:hypothetical protein
MAIRSILAGVGAYLPARARAVFDDHLLAEDLAHAGRHDAAHNVEGAAGCERHDHDDRPRRIGLRLSRKRPSGEHSNQYSDASKPTHHALLFIQEYGAPHSTLIPAVSITLPT